MGTCEEYLQSNKALWTSLLEPEFIRRCADNSIKQHQFNTWIQQDYLFVVDFLRFLARVVAAAPRVHFNMLISGLNALREELSWYEAKAAERGVNLQVAKDPLCEDYAKYMESLSEEPYPVQAMAAWAIEYSYNEAWRRAGKLKPPYDEFAERWSEDEFASYVQQLASQADEVLLESSQEVRKQAEEVCNRIAELEISFWQMALDA